MCEHLLGPISPVTRTRTCHRCGERVPAEGTYEVTRLNGTLEVYPAGLFSQWDGHQIRKFLNVNRRAGDTILHNWFNNCVYVFRAPAGSTLVEVEEDESAQGE
jgi:hypothetical protein